MHFPYPAPDSIRGDFGARVSLKLGALLYRVARPPGRPVVVRRPVGGAALPGRPAAGSPGRRVARWVVRRPVPLTAAPAPASSIAAQSGGPGPVIQWGYPVGRPFLWRRIFNGLKTAYGAADFQSGRAKPPEIGIFPIPRRILSAATSGRGVSLKLGALLCQYRPSSGAGRRVARWWCGGQFGALLCQYRPVVVVQRPVPLTAAPAPASSGGARVSLKLGALLYRVAGSPGRRVVVRAASSFDGPGPGNRP